MITTTQPPFDPPPTGRCDAVGGGSLASRVLDTQAVPQSACGRSPAPTSGTATLLRRGTAYECTFPAGIARPDQPRPMKSQRGLVRRGAGSRLGQQGARHFRVRRGHRDRPFHAFSRVRGRHALDDAPRPDVGGFARRPIATASERLPASSRTPLPPAAGPADEHEKARRITPSGPRQVGLVETGEN